MVLSTVGRVGATGDEAAAVMLGLTAVGVTGSNGSVFVIVVTTGAGSGSNLTGVVATAASGGISCSDLIEDTLGDIDGAGGSTTGTATGVIDVCFRIGFSVIGHVVGVGVVGVVVDTQASDGE